MIGGLGPCSKPGSMLLLGNEVSIFGDTLQRGDVRNSAELPLSPARLVVCYPNLGRGKPMMKQAIRIAPLIAAAAFVAAAGTAPEAFAQAKPGASSAASKQIYAAAAAFQNEGVLELAAEEWEAFLKRFGTDPLAADARFNLGACYFKLGKFDQAAEAYAAVAEKHPKFDLMETNLLNLGIASFKAAQAAGGDKVRFEQAAVALERFLSRFPNSKQAGEALLLRAEALNSAGRAREAVASWTELFQRNPNFPQRADMLYTVSVGLLQSNKPAEARKVIDRLVRDHPDHALTAAAKFELGEYEYHHVKDFAAAAKAYAMAKSCSQDRLLSEKVEYKLGWAYYQLRDFARAEQVFAAALKEHADGKLAADIQLMIGECLFKQDRFEAAIPYFAKASRGKLSSDTLAALGLLRLGQCNARLNRTEASLAALDRLTSQFANSSYGDEAKLERAGVLEKLGRVDEATQAYKSLSEQSASPLAMQAQFMVGQLYAERGNHREAVREFYKLIHGFSEPKTQVVAGEAKTLSPAQSWKSQALFAAARSFEALQNREQAGRLYRELIEQYPACERTVAAKQRLAALATQR